MKYLLPTLRLLTTSIPVALSGVFRLHIAFLFLGVTPDILIYLAGFLVIYSTYTFDRASGSDEDKINRKELTSARKDVAVLVCLVSLMIGTFLLSRKGLAFMAFMPFIIGYVYSKGVTIGNRKLKLKGNFGVKNLTVAITWGTFISGIALRWADSSIVLPVIFPFFALKSFINTVIYDFRDIKGDGAAGIMTLPIYLGEKNTRLLLQVLHFMLHIWVAIAMLTNQIHPEIAILLWVAISGSIYTYFYTKAAPENESRIRKAIRDILVDGEFIMAVILSSVIGF
jgi:4-hydroxybenzoate polyprenyltransferase